jgi:hypothetical protein
MWRFHHLASSVNWGLAACLALLTAGVPAGEGEAVAEFFI